MPDQHTELVADVVKAIILPDAATPDADHDLVSIDHHLQPLAIPRLADPRREAIGGNPVGATTEDVNTVEAEIERLAVLVRLLDELALAEAGALGDGIQLDLSRGHGRGDIVEGLIAVAMRIPQLRVVDVELNARFAILAHVRSPLEHVLATQLRAERDLLARAALHSRSDRPADLLEARGNIVIHPQILHPSLIRLQPYSLPRSASHQHRSPVPAVMILRLPHSQTSHIAIEANPLVLRMRILDLAGLDQGRLEIDLEDVLAGLQVLGDVDPVHDEHVVALQDRLPVELDGGVGV